MLNHIWGSVYGFKKDYRKNKDVISRRTMFFFRMRLYFLSLSLSFFAYLESSFLSKMDSALFRLMLRNIRIDLQNLSENFIMARGLVFFPKGDLFHVLYKKSMHVGDNSGRQLILNKSNLIYLINLFEKILKSGSPATADNRRKYSGKIRDCVLYIAKGDNGLPVLEFDFFFYKKQTSVGRFKIHITNDDVDKLSSHDKVIWSRMITEHDKIFQNTPV